MSIDGNDVMIVLGMAGVFAGLALVSWAAALAVTGSALFVLGLVGAMRKAQR